MRYPRFSIRGLMLTTVLLGVVFAALSHPNLGWGVFLGNLVLVLLLTSILGIVLRRGRQRAFWIGFALFGWVEFLVFSWIDLLGHLSQHYFVSSWEALFELMMVPLSREKANVSEIVQGLSQADDNSITLVAGSVTVLVFALLGAGIALVLAPKEPTGPDRRALNVPNGNREGAAPTQPPSGVSSMPARAIPEQDSPRSMG